MRNKYKYLIEVPKVNKHKAHRLLIIQSWGKNEKGEKIEDSNKDRQKFEKFNLLRKIDGSMSYFPWKM